MARVRDGCVRQTELGRRRELGEDALELRDGVVVAAVLVRLPRKRAVESRHQRTEKTPQRRRILHNAFVDVMPPRRRVKTARKESHADGKHGSLSLSLRLLDRALQRSEET